ncbi:MAG: hypothetical protein ACR2PQ_09710 [Myxococcota bacterium]
MPTWLRFVLGTLLTAGLCYASHWLWLWAEKEIKGTPFGDFKFFASLLAVFALLSLAQLVVNVGTRILDRRGQSGS